MLRGCEGSDSKCKIFIGAFAAERASAPDDKLFSPRIVTGDSPGRVLCKIFIGAFVTE